MSVKAAGVGHFTIPTAPAAGTSVTSGTANTFTTSAVQLIASTSAALYITGVHLEAAAAKAATYIIVQLMIGGAGAETVIGQYLVPLSTGSTVALGYRQIYPFIPVANGVRIAAKTADSVGSAATLVTLECIAQTNVVDDGITVGTVNLVNTLTTYTGNTPQTGDSFLVVKSGGAGDNAAIKAKTDFLPSATAGAAGGVFIAGANAATTVNFTGNLSGSVGSVTGAVGSVTGAVGSVTGAVGSVTGNVGGNVVGSVASVTAAIVLPAIPANWITAAGIAAAALNGKGDWLLASGYTAPDNTSIGTLIARLTAARALNLDNLDATVSSRVVGSSLPANFSSLTISLAGAVTAGTVGDKTGCALTADYDAAKTALAASSYTAPDNASVTAIKTKTDQLAFAVAGQADVNLKSVAGTAITGAGTALNPWGP